jgi:hypothetical protein
VLRVKAVQNGCIQAFLTISEHSIILELVNGHSAMMGGLMEAGIAQPQFEAGASCKDGPIHHGRGDAVGGEDLQCQSML